MIMKMKIVSGSLMCDLIHVQGLVYHVQSQSFDSIRDKGRRHVKNLHCNDPGTFHTEDEHFVP